MRTTVPRRRSVSIPINPRPRLLTAIRARRIRCVSPSMAMGTSPIKSRRSSKQTEPFSRWKKLPAPAIKRLSRLTSTALAEALSQQGTITDSAGTRSFLKEEPTAEGGFGKTTTTWSGGGIIVEESNPDGGLTRSVTSTIGDQVVQAIYRVDTSNQETQVGVPVINGEPPNEPGCAEAGAVWLEFDRLGAHSRWFRSAGRKDNI